MRVMPVFGTRPEAIKLAPVIRTLEESSDFEVLPVVTGQHRQMLDQVLAVFRIHPVVDLDIMEAEQSLTHVTCAALSGLERVLRELRPDVVLVQGDTTTTFAAALAAFYQRIPVGHVEAGLRSGDLGNPFPEELNRRLTAVVTRWHFAPTRRARQRLLAEGVDPAQVWVTGNTVIDALWDVARRTTFAPRGELAHLTARGLRLLLVTTHRRESWGEPHRRVYRALKELVRRFEDVAVVLSVHPNPAVRRVVEEELAGAERVVLLPPPDYGEFVGLLKACYLVLTDSGGIQEEAPALGRPVLVLREVTERPEGLEAGCARLVGTDPVRIVEEVGRLLSDPAAYQQMARARNPYGDGLAARRIEQVLRRAFGLPVGEPVVPASFDG
ncbi:MAG TPA: UDP-N-acetylglucosamine 2-epimerase (non-hydrolyzing) [Limnochordales bacterium]